MRIVKDFRDFSTLERILEQFQNSNFEWLENPNECGFCQILKIRIDQGFKHAGFTSGHLLSDDRFFRLQIKTQNDFEVLMLIWDFSGRFKMFKRFKTTSDFQKI